MIRNILDYLGNVIGELELSDDTPEEVWTEKLAMYARAPAATLLPDVTARQMRQALVLSGIDLATIDTAINSLSEPNKSLVRIEWEYSNMFQRYRPTVLAIGAMLGKSSSDLDDLWRLAFSLP